MGTRSAFGGARARRRPTSPRPGGWLIPAGPPARREPGDAGADPRLQPRQSPATNAGVTAHPVEEPGLEVPVVHHRRDVGPPSGATSATRRRRPATPGSRPAPANCGTIAYSPRSSRPASESASTCASAVRPTSWRHIALVPSHCFRGSSAQAAASPLSRRALPWSISAIWSPLVERARPPGLLEREIVLPGAERDRDGGVTDPGRERVEGERPLRLLQRRVPPPHVLQGVRHATGRRRPSRA